MTTDHEEEVTPPPIDRPLSDWHRFAIVVVIVGLLFCCAAVYESGLFDRLHEWLAGITTR